MDGPKRPDGIYVIRFRNHHERAQGTRNSSAATASRAERSTSFNFGAPGFGADLQEGAPRAGDPLGLAGFGEALPRYENFVEIDKSVTDAYGIPTLKIHMAWSDNERAMIPDMAESAAEMLEAAGAKNIAPLAGRPTASPATGSTRWASRAWARTRRPRS